MRGQGKEGEKMKVYELMSLLSQAEAGTEVTAVVYLSPTKLIQHSDRIDRIDNDLFCLTFEIEKIDPDEGNITLKF